MSVTTEADRALDEAHHHLGKARNDLRAAYRCYAKVLVDRCWGHDEYTEVYKQKIRSEFLAVQQMMLDMNEWTTGEEQEP